MVGARCCFDENADNFCGGKLFPDEFHRSLYPFLHRPGFREKVRLIDPNCVIDFTATLNPESNFTTHMASKRKPIQLVNSTSAVYKATSDHMDTQFWRYLT